MLGDGRTGRRDDTGTGRNGGRQQRALPIERSIEPWARAGQPASDPLAELARLIGQNDPFADLPGSLTPQPIRRRRRSDAAPQPQSEPPPRRQRAGAPVPPMPAPRYADRRRVTASRSRRIASDCAGAAAPADAPRSQPYRAARHPAPIAADRPGRRDAGIPS